MQQRYLVQHVGEPLALLLPVYVESPNGVVERFGTHVHLVGERLLGEMLERTRELEVLRYVVLPVKTEHCLSLLCIVSVALERHVHACSGVDDALIEDGHLATRVVHGVVGALGKGHAACRYHH